MGLGSAPGRVAANDLLQGSGHEGYGSPAERVTLRLEEPDAVPDPRLDFRGHRHCSPRLPRQAAPSAPGATPEAPKPTPAPMVEVDGSWTSPSCGDRGYERTVAFGGDGTYAGQDLVAPCPPGAVCVWSGVVDFSGTYAIDGATVTLTELKASSGPGASARPAALERTPEGLVEIAGDARCAYLRP